MVSGGASPVGTYVLAIRPERLLYHDMKRNRPRLAPCLTITRSASWRSDICVTQTFHLIPQGRSARFSLSAIPRSF